MQLPAFALNQDNYSPKYWHVGVQGAVEQCACGGQSFDKRGSGAEGRIPERGCNLEENAASQRCQALGAGNQRGAAGVVPAMLLYVMVTRVRNQRPCISL